jgi:hypothetical protein
MPLTATGDLVWVDGAAELGAASDPLAETAEVLEAGPAARPCLAAFVAEDAEQPLAWRVDVVRLARKNDHPDALRALAALIEPCFDAPRAAPPAGPGRGAPC